MADLIDRAAALAKSFDIGAYSNVVSAYDLATFPSVDAVEVVRCKDCVWWEPHTHGSLIGRCENPRNGLVNEYTDDTDFCSYGERKEQK